MKWSMGRVARALGAITAIMGTSALALSVAPPAQASSPLVALYPGPGTNYNLPGTQIAFRGIPPEEIGTIGVTGSITGVHSGHIEADSDGGGGSFLPSQPFVPGETVTVTTSLDIVGGAHGSFSFKIAHPGGTIQPMFLPTVPAGPGGVQHFASEPDLKPPSITVGKDSAAASEGDLFVATQYGPAQNGPMILDPRGNLVWFDPFSVGTMLVTDFRVQKLHGSRVLTWWQGFADEGNGAGEGVIFNRHYQEVATVHAGNGLPMDLHEFLITPRGDAWLEALSPLSLPRVTHKPVVDSVIQEIDVKTGLVLFEWHALDHIPLSESYATPRTNRFMFDPYHANSVGVDREGNVVVSMRDTSAVYKINRRTGRIMWELGGKRPTLKMGPGTATAFQHDAVVEPDGSLTIFDNGAGLPTRRPPRLHRYSRGIRVMINAARRTATLERQYDHSPQLSSDFEGSVQVLPDGNVFLGWGQQPYFSEVGRAGRQIFDAHYTAPTATYRAYRFVWNGRPLTSPALAVLHKAAGSIVLHASWNGATDVARWKVLAGPSPSAMSAVASVTKRGFETEITVHRAAAYFAVQALGSNGTVLATSEAQATPAHAERHDNSAFASLWAPVQSPWPASRPTDAPDFSGASFTSHGSPVDDRRLG